MPRAADDYRLDRQGGRLRPSEAMNCLARPCAGVGNRMRAHRDGTMLPLEDFFVYKNRTRDPTVASSPCGRSPFHGTIYEEALWIGQSLWTETHGSSGTSLVVENGSGNSYQTGCKV